MLRFNNTHIITGQIKQLLAEFNLPRYRIYTKEMAKYVEKEGKESPEVIFTIKKDAATDATGWNTSYYVNYIKDNCLQKCIVDGQSSAGVSYNWETSNNFHYHYNKKELNQTKNLKITNNYYDSYTHEYLGDFLRFQRDYNNLDLMPLYNCFSDRECPNIELNFNINGAQVSFVTADSRYKIYMLPVKLFKKYTIAIDCNELELFCGYYDKYLATDLPNQIASYTREATYKSFHGLRFNKPVLYTNLTADSILPTKNELSESAIAMKIALAKYEPTLKMFIKIPINCNSSITILEGDYTTFNDRQVKLDNRNHLIKTNNHYVTNYEMSSIGEATRNSYEPAEIEYADTDIAATQVYPNPELDERPFVPITSLQLLSLNSGYSYPFADRLIEYLLGNVVTNMDTINDNIKRAQKVMQNNGHNFEYYGLWDNKMRNIAYDYMNSTDSKIIRTTSNANHDILGYVDKDIERYYTSWTNVIVKDKYGKPIQDMDEYGNPKYVRVANALADTNTKLLKENRQKYLLSSESATEVPVYKTKDIPAMTIQNVDIYDGLYDLEEDN